MSLIALDLRMVRGPMHGIARYGLALAARLPRLMPEHDFAALVAEGARPLPAGLRPVPCRAAFLSPLEQLELPLVLDALRPDLVHWTSFSTAALAFRTSVITLHDAAHLAFEGGFGALHRLYYRTIVQPVARRCARIMTVSEFAARELARHLGLDDVAVIPNGVDEKFVPPSAAEIATVRSRLALPDRFALYVGSAKRHKNARVLFEAAARAGVPSVAVVPAAAADWPSHVRVLRDVDDELPALYGAAAVFGFPSLYESFGLPPLEALACGTPVVASNAGGLPEVLGDAATLLDPSDVDAWTRALHAAMAEPRTSGIERRLARARAFSWDEAARATAEIYREALRGEHRAPSAARSPAAR